MLQTAERRIMTEETILTDDRKILSGVRVIDPVNRIEGLFDVAVEGGTVASMEPASGNGSGLWLIPGVVDMHVHLRIPGGENSETLETGLKAAVAGGVTRVGMMPNTTPALDTPEAVSEVTARGNSLGLALIHPVPAVTMGRKGIECTDFEAFSSMGITCFSDDGSPVMNDSSLAEAFKRLAPLNGVVIEHPEVVELAAGGAVNLGEASNLTGAKGIPEEAEYRDVERCIRILGESGTGCRLHLTHLSSPESVRLVAQAASEGLPVTCDVTPHHIALEETELLRKGTLAKMNPPLRSEESRRKLVSMAASGMVSAVASDHAPHHRSKKDCLIQDAAFGITGLETLLPITVDKLVNGASMSLMEVVAMLTSAPASVLGITIPGITAGEPAEMVLFDPDEKWTFTDSLSLSGNSPFLNTELRGKVLSVWRGRELYREGQFV
ncbi:dihydroorotase [Candidatus Fermentibacteria bacterium]|nr:MAG: dihydroorotase [Candidatus Fermentibacteria bacterium]